MRGKRAARGAVLSALAILFFPAQAAWAAAAPVLACPPSKTPIKLNFKTVTSPTRYNHGLTLPGIANMVRSQGGEIGGGSRPVGLTLANTVFGLEGGTSLLKRGDGLCAYLTSVEIDFGWERMDVYVPSEFPEGSCEYRAVLDHENQHVAIIRSTLAEFAPRARARVEAIVAQAKPFTTRTQNGATEAALAPIKTRLSALLREFNELHGARSARIDNPSNYAAVTAMCKNWDGAGTK